MRRELRRVINLLAKRLKPPKPPAIMILPDDGSGDDLPPHLRGDGDPAWPLHLVRPDGSCKQCRERHLDDPRPDGERPETVGAPVEKS